jgi:hypothetical protein
MQKIYFKKLINILKKLLTSILYNLRWFELGEHLIWS